MKLTRIKVSISEDGLLPQETAELVNIQFPVLPKKLLRAMGFEKVDNSTFVGVLPVFVNVGGKEQEIELEFGVYLPEMRKKMLEILQKPFQDSNQAESTKVVKSAKTSPRTRARKTAKTKSDKNTTTPKQSSKKQTRAKRATSKKTKG